MTEVVYLGSWSVLTVSSGSTLSHLSVMRAMLVTASSVLRRPRVRVLRTVSCTL